MRARVLLAGLGVLAAAVLHAPPAQAAPNCPSARVGGETVAWISLGSTKVPVKRVSFRRGEALHPPDTNQAAGLSGGHAPLAARGGTTVITWHVRFGPGCYGTLNPILKKPIGSTFTVRRVGKPAQQYEITDSHEVRKGRYRAAWFRQGGPHQLALFTCSGFERGKFLNTSVIIAKPVAATPSEIPVPIDPAPAPAAPSEPPVAEPPPADSPVQAPAPG